MPIKFTQERVRRSTDDRGFVFEPLPDGGLAQQKNVHVAVSRPGVVRGNHYHRQGTETLVVCGPALVRIRSGQATEDIPIPADSVRRVVIPPGVAHAVKNTGTRDSFLVAFNTEAHDPDAPDTVQEILIPA